MSKPKNVLGQLKDVASHKERFLSRVKKTDDCWLWMGRVNEKGYGVMPIARKNFSAHRLSYEYFIGDIEVGEMVLHSCDVRSCVNPAHLFLGDAKLNAIDASSKGRTFTGEHNNNCRHPDEVIEFVRNSDLHPKVLRQMFGISDVHVYRIRNRRSRKQPTGEAPPSFETLRKIKEQASERVA